MDDVEFRKVICPEDDDTCTPGWTGGDFEEWYEDEEKWEEYESEKFNFRFLHSNNKVLVNTKNCVKVSEISMN